MRQFVSIAVNTFMELVRQPVFLLLATCSSGFAVFLAAVPYFGFGEDPKLVKDSTLAVMLLSGLFGAVLSASASLSREIRQGTALAVLSKPVGRAKFLLAKYVGLAASLTVLTYVNLLGALLASKMAFDAYGDADLGALGAFFGAVVVAYGLGGFSNYFLRRPFVADAMLALVGTVSVAVAVMVWFVPKTSPWGEAMDADWRLLPAAVLILFALWVLAGVALASATRFDMIPTLAICTGVFLLGLMSDYLFGRLADPVWNGNLVEESRNLGRSEEQRRLLAKALETYDGDKDGRLNLTERDKVSEADREAMVQAGLGGRRWASVLYTVFPNWQLFWLADALEGKNQIPWSYVGQAVGYVVGYLGATLVAALLLFEHRELS